ncbi:MAG: GNAT family N-acetyltransferase, partial [Chitinophagaceae bacterium]
GEKAKQGWTHEADLISGEVRIDEASLTDLLNNKLVTFLKYIGNGGLCEGCVCLELQGTQLYLGMLSVSPTAQAQGIGRTLLEGSEKHALSIGVTTIVMHVIPLRTELIAWYQRRGYENTGIVKPFPEGDQYGLPRQPIHFTVLQKDFPA